MRTKKTFRLLALVFSLALIIALIPMSAFADENPVSPDPAGVETLLGEGEDPAEDPSEAEEVPAAEPDDPAEPADGAEAPGAPAEDDPGNEAPEGGSGPEAPAEDPSEAEDPAENAPEAEAPAELPEADGAAEDPADDTDETGELFGASTTVTTWNGLQSAINSAASGDVIVLGENITAGSSDSYINIPSGKNITIDLNGKTLDRNRETADEDGHVIKVSGTLTVTDSVGTGVIKGGYAEDGGGIYVDGRNAVLTIKGGSISENKASNNGGGIYVYLGKLYIESGTISKNTAGRSGGGLHFWGIRRWEQSPFVYTESAGEVEITSAVFSENEAAQDGGAMCLYGSTTTIHDVTVSNNEAGRNGGGIAFIRETYINMLSQEQPLSGDKFDAELNLYGGTITGNSADSEGGGLYINKRYGMNQNGQALPHEENVTVNIKGAITIQENDADNLYLGGIPDLGADNKKLPLTVVGPLTGSSIGIKVGDRRLNGVFTKNYSTNNPNIDPALYFNAEEDGRGVFLEDGEAVLKAQARIAGRDFIPIDSQIRSKNKLSPNNWMAGISGERYLYEINTPHTHDSAMWKTTAPWDSSIGAGLGYHEYAHTQYVSIKQQLEDGVRVLDLRLNPVYWGRDGDWRHGTMEMDDGENLWLCHGKNSGGGVYYTEDEEGNRLSLQKVLDWVQEFLEANPTETVILIFDAEITNANASKGYRGITFQRIADHLEKLAAQENPSNGKSYIYTEQGKTFRDKYTQWPQLKDCRGQAVIKVCEPEDFDYIGGFIDYGLAPVTDIAPEKGGGNCVIASEKIENLKPYFEQCEEVQIPKNAGTHLTTFHHADSNSKANAVTDFIVDIGRTIAGQTTMSPLAIAYEVHKNVFQDEKYFEGDAIGNYYGFFKMDGAVRSENRTIWLTNFPDDLDYITVFVDPGTGGEAYLPQQFQLLRYTQIDIPGCIYDNPNENGGEFQYWEAYDAAGTKIGDFYEGDQYTLPADTVFKAVWSDTPRTTIRIEWKDADDKDGLRPASLNLRTDSGHTVAVTAEGGWKISYAGDLESVVPVWERIVTDGGSQYGNDADGQYRYKVSGKMREGFVITLIHTPADTIPISAKIIWEDEENIDGLRPDSVTLRLTWKGDNIQSAIVSESDGWTCDFGLYRRYVDGEEAEYVITEDDIEGYSISCGRDESDENAVYGSSIINIHVPPAIVFSGYVTWDDNDDAEGARPDSVTVHLLADGEEIASGEVTETVWGEDDHTGIWQWEFTVYKSLIENAEEITVEGEEIPRYSVKVQESDTYTRKIIGEDGEPAEETVDVDPPYYDVIYTFDPERPKEKVERVEPTCTEDGNIEYWYLDVESDDGEAVRKYFTDMTGEEEITQADTVLPATGHDWGGWQTFTEPTADKAGEERQICKNDPEHTKSRATSLITYDLNGGTYKGETGKVTRIVVNGETITLPSPTRSGYIFDYWQGSHYDAGDSYTVKGSHTFKAIWLTRAVDVDPTPGGSGGTPANTPGGTPAGTRGAKTGDVSRPGLWLGLGLTAALALIALAVVTVYQKKRREDE